MGYKLRTSSKIIKRKTGRSSNQKYKKFMVFLLSSIGVLILVLAILLITFSHRGFGSAQATATPTVTNTPSPSLTEAMPSPTAFFTILPMGSPLPTAKGATPFPTDMPPLVAVTGNSTMVLELNSVYNESGATAVDNKGSALGVTISGNVNTAKEGSYIVVYQATDSSGRVGKAARTVVVRSAAENAIANKIYLSFDDGPSLQNTPRILDILKANQIKATFFIIDYTPAEKPLIQRMIDEGHTVALHSYTHKFDCIYTSPQAYMDDLAKLHDKLYQDFNYDARIIRFPGGSSNTKSRNYCAYVMTDLVVRVQEAGYLFFDWNVDTGDADANGVKPDILYANFTGQIKKDRTNVVLMHDLSTKETTVDVLQRDIDFAKSNGYEFLPITNTTTPIHHHVNN